MTKIAKFTTLLTVSAALAVPSTALAADPGDTVYNPNQEVLGVVNQATPTPTPAPAVEQETDKPQSTPTAEATPVATPTTQTEQARPGDLPFTGFEAGFVALAGLALLGGGVAMRRAARSDD